MNDQLILEVGFPQGTEISCPRAHLHPAAISSDSPCQDTESPGEHMHPRATGALFLKRLPSIYMDPLKQ